MKILITLLFLLFLFSSTIISQTSDDFICAPIADNPNGNFSITGGKYKPSRNNEGEYLRVLLAFVQFEGDNSEADDWTPNELPGWAYSFLDASSSEEYTDKTYSDYWNEMAVGDFDVIGNVYPDLIILPSEETYANAIPSKNFSHTNLDAIEIIDDWMPTKGSGTGWNWTPYENWDYDPGTQTYIFNAGNADGYVDMIFMIYRNATYKINPNDPDEDPGEWFGGSWGLFTAAATLGNIAFEYVTNDDLIVSSGDGWISDEGSGITYRTGGPNGKRGLLGNMSHEYGHYLFGANHTNYSGIMGGGTYAMNGWERMRVDQIQPIPASGNGNEYILGDFIETGDVLKIPIPFSNPNSTTYYLVENHQRASSYDHIVRGGPIEGGWDYSGLGKGIFVYKVKYGDVYATTPLEKFELLAADGYFDWVYTGDFSAPGFHVNSDCPDLVPITERVMVNTESGKNDRMPGHIAWCNIVGDAAKWCDVNPLTKEHELSRDVMGDLTDAFNLGYNELITNWSNPSTYVNGSTNISIQLYDYNETNGEFTIKVFSTYVSALSLPPSKPQFLIVTEVNGLAQLDWAEFKEPDMAPNGKYRVYRYAAAGNEPPVFTTHIAEIDAYIGGEPVTQWTDINPAVGSGDKKLFYAISALDNFANESLLSDFDWVYWDENFQKTGGEKISKNYEYSLFDNYPNPFNPTTMIDYAIKKDGLVKLKVYDILGRELETLISEHKPAGYYSVEFNAEQLPSGIYIYRLTSGNFTASKKLILMK